MREAVIVASSRTGLAKSFRGSFNQTRPDDMAAHCVKDVLKKTPQLDPKEIEDVIMGAGFPEGPQGFNTGRNVALLADLPVTVPGGTVSARLSGDATITNGLLLLPPHHDFGTVPVGQQSGRFTFALSNTSTTSTVGNLAFSQVGNGIYAIVLPPPLFQIVDATDCTVTHKNQLLPQESCNIVFAYNPNANNIGLKQLMWQATGNIPGAVPITVTADAHVQGTGM